MSLSCDSGDDGDYGDSDRWWYNPLPESPLDTRRSRKCISCADKIKVGDIARKVCRYRNATEFEQDRGIANDEVPMSNWYLCEKCGDLASSLEELEFCYSLGDESLQSQIAEYRQMEKENEARISKAQ